MMAPTTNGLALMLALAVLCFGTIRGESELDCPNQVECRVDPCQEARCQRFPNALCVPNNCNGTCTAEFRHVKHSHHRITNCSLRTCDHKRCKGKHICVHEAFPTVCHKGPGTCKQVVKPHCRRPPSPLPAISCQELTCTEGKACIVSHTRMGPVAKCLAKRPVNCEELGPCDEGMECKVLENEVRCTAKMTVRKPEDCSVLKTCPTGLECMVLGWKGRERARCVSIPPKN